MVDRRRVELWDKRTPLQAYHAANSQSERKAAETVRRAAEAANAVAERAMSDLIEEMRAAGYAIGGAGVVFGNQGAPREIAPVGLSHAGAHFAEGELYRGALMDAISGLGIVPVGASERKLAGHEAEALIERPAGPPWTKDHRQAAIVAWMALPE